jgi:hypothetical protein
MLLCPDQSARGLAQSKTLARRFMADVNAKRLGLRWPSTAFSPRRVNPIARVSLGNKIAPCFMEMLQAGGLAGSATRWPPP